MKPEQIKLFTLLNLQYFAEGEGDTTEVPEAPEAPGAPGAPEAPEAQEKTFTQKDVNNLISKESKVAIEKFLKENGVTDFATAKEGMQKFKEWQESQKTELQRQQESYDAAQLALANAQKEKDALAAQLEAFKQGVNPEYLEDAILLATARIKDDVTFEDAIKSVLDKNPHYKGSITAEKPPLFSTGTHQAPPPSNVDAFAAKLAKYKK